jgi:hypothetical protein
MKVQLTAGGVAGLAAVGVLGYVAYKVMNMDPNLINPASDKNVVNQAVTGVVGESNMATAGDYFFATVDLVNPWNDSDYYAAEVYGINNLRRRLGWE